MYLVLGTTYYYIKSDKVDKEHGYIGGTSSFRPPGHHYLPLTIGMTEPTLPSIHVCPRRTLQCSAVQATARQAGRIYPIRVPRKDFFTALACSTALYLYSLSR